MKWGEPEWEKIQTTIMQLTSPPAGAVGQLCFEKATYFWNTVSMSLKAFRICRKFAGKISKEEILLCRIF